MHDGLKRRRTVAESRWLVQPQSPTSASRALADPPFEGRIGSRFREDGSRPVTAARSVARADSAASALARGIVVVTVARTEKNKRRRRRSWRKKQSC